MLAEVAAFEGKNILEMAYWILYIYIVYGQMNSNVEKCVFSNNHTVFFPQKFLKLMGFFSKKNLYLESLSQEQFFFLAFEIGLPNLHFFRI